MGKAKNILDAIASVLEIRRYLIIASVSAAALFAILYYLMVFIVADNSIMIFSDMNGLWFSVLSILSIVVIALAFGINLALISFTLGRLRKPSVEGNSASIAGVIAGAFASGCPTCGSLLFALVGSPLALFSMPFQGLELKAVSIALLASSTYLLAVNIGKCNGVCKK